MTVNELLDCCDNCIGSEEFFIFIVGKGKVLFDDTYCKLYEEANSLLNCKVERFSVRHGQMKILLGSI